MPGQKRLWPIILFPLSLVALGVIPFIFRRQLGVLFSSVEQFQEIITDLGIWGAAVFIAIQILQVLLFVIPGSAVQISGGYLFGTALE